MCGKFVLSYHNLVQCIFTDLLDSAPSDEEDMDDLDTIAVESAASDKMNIVVPDVGAVIIAKIYSCSECPGKIFTTKKYLRAHMKK